MADFTLSRASVFPAGTTVGAYPRSNWLTHELPPSGAPKGAAAATAVVASDGTCAFTALNVDTGYFAHAQVAGEDRYIEFFTFTPEATGGTPGSDGASAYEVAVANGFAGTEAEWLASLEGAQGAAGPAGPEGPQGPEGPAGAAGDAGASAYDVAVANGFVGTEDQWLDSLVSEIDATVQTGDYELVLADKGTVVEIDSSVAATVTVPTNATVAFAVGTIIEVCQLGAGQVTLAPASGVTLHFASSLTTRAQYATVVLRKRAADEWVVGGDAT